MPTLFIVYTDSSAFEHVPVDDYLNIHVIPSDQTIEKFKLADEQNCYICNSAWNKRVEHPAAWEALQAQSWKGLTYQIERVEEKIDSSPIEIVFSVQYTDPLSDSFGMIRFVLIHPKNENLRSQFTFPSIEPQTSSLSSLGTAYSWYQQCLNEHHECSAPLAPKQGWLPTRLVDIGPESSTTWRLIITGEDVCQSSKSLYVTLSYRWGLNPRLLLLRSSIAEFRAGKSIENLPQTFRDLTVVARFFGIRYLWVDCLCILQDSADDWEDEAATMAHVYAHSACNIAAAAASDPDRGLFRSRDLDMHGFGIVSSTIGQSIPAKYFITYLGYFERQLAGNSLLARGWVFQEWFLAPRMLYFTKAQIMWECSHTDRRSETFPDGIPFGRSIRAEHRILKTLASDSLRTRGLTPDKCVGLWVNLVTRYSRCQLTRSSDKLVAIAGIAKLFLDITEDKYYAGLWRSQLLHQLGWKVVHPQPRNMSDYRAPSWSWAAIDGGVWHVHVDSEAKHPLKLIEVDVSTRSKDATVGITVGRLLIRGTIIMAKVRKFEKDQLRISTIPDNIPIVLHVSPDDTDAGLSENTTLRLLLYKQRNISVFNKYPEIEKTHIETTFLVLEPVTNPTGTKRTYRRIALCLYSGKKAAELCISSMQINSEEEIVIV